MSFLGKIFQLKISLIAIGKTTSRVYGNSNASFKLVEISIAAFSFGIRVTLRI